MTAMAGYITRSAGGNLQINDLTNYRLDHPNEGWLESIQWEKQVATSPFYHGDFLVNAVKRSSSINLRILVFASTVALLIPKVDTLIEAISQFSYSLVLSKGITDYMFSCQPADYLADYRWLMYEEDIFVMPVTLICPIQPNPVIVLT